MVAPLPVSEGGIASEPGTISLASSTSTFQSERIVSSKGASYPQYAPHVPHSQRWAPPLDMSTVERRGHLLAARESNKRIRPHGIKEAPTFCPTEEEFRDPFAYVQKIRTEGEKYGICKIIPPPSWKPEFSINTERFFFKTRRQELNSVEGGARTNLQYLDQLAKFHKQHGMNLNRFPSVDKRPLDLYKLKKAVETRGGFERVCKGKKWAEIGRDLGYSGKIMSSLSTSLKNSYQKWLHPYEEYLKMAKPGVQQQLELENGGPFTPSLSSRPQGSQSDTPVDMKVDSPAIRASIILNASINDKASPPDRKIPRLELPTALVSSSFTAVNASTSGWAAVNKATPCLYSAAPPSQNYSPGSPFPAASKCNIEAGSVCADSSGFTAKVTSMMEACATGVKRGFNSEDVTGASSPEPSADGDDQNERRSKRVKKAPTIVGSHMGLLRTPTPRLPCSQRTGRPGEICEICGTKEKDDRCPLLLCVDCEFGYHKDCLDPSVRANPGQEWHCSRCLVGTGDFGFEEGGVYSLRQFQEKAQHFKDVYFEPRMQFDPVLNAKRPVTEDDVEREFWRLVESPSEEIEVEYGADIHSTTHGSGFPTIEKNPLDLYSTDRWNLNILPLHEDSLFRHIKSDISGMTVPWLYVGMCFSTFCWHNEDHYAYSSNYQHFGSTKTWYGIPGSDALNFEEAMRKAVPELFETQPDLLFQLVTLLPPDRLRKAGVNVFALDQRAGQFVITFPQAYHAGFNHGFNFNEAVNFAPHDWEPYGQAGVERLQEFRKQPCFSHDELLMTAASRDTSIKTAKWLAPALQRIRDRELRQRLQFVQRHKCQYELDRHPCKTENHEELKTECRLGFEINDQDMPEVEFQCCHCKAYNYFSSFRCNSTGLVMCLLHAGDYECCDVDEVTRYKGDGHVLRYRMSDDALNLIVQRVIDRANMPSAWQEKVDRAINDENKPSLKMLRSLVSEGEKIPWILPGLPDLKTFVEKCNEWIDEATTYITRKQQNRRKNDRIWRKGTSTKTAEFEERDKEFRKFENIHSLLKQAEALSFDSPEITVLAERALAIEEFQHDAQVALENPKIRSTQEFEDLAEMGKGFNVDIPETEHLEIIVQKMRWTDEAREKRNKFQTLDDLAELIRRGSIIGITDDDMHMRVNKDLLARGELWECKAKELMAMEVIHHPQLEALSAQANALPITNETRIRVDAILSKQREAQRRILFLYDSCKEDDIRKRPSYKEVREVLDNLFELNSKPNGTVDLENAAKRHENWMRKGKKLFGKANAPLHILQAHMNYVADHNSYCFDLSDKPRLPVEPQSRENSPADEPEADGVKSEKNVFCMCRQSEAGTMIECGLCHEWYHSKCLKIARGKVKEDDEYKCPICDYRVKIPRDAARPKLEDLIDWKDEIQDLPFQPEEEDILTDIIDKANTFREYVRPLINPVMTSPEELTTQRFYLRKIEGAEILLSFETNFFRQEVHKWSPVAPEPPPVLEQSLSTRKPRPTKQQRLMQQHNVSTPEELPLQFRRKEYNTNKVRTASSSSTLNIQAAPARRPRSSHSSSTSLSADCHQTRRRSHNYSVASQEPVYSAQYPISASHNPHRSPDSATFENSPYYILNAHDPQSPYTNSPRYATSHSPLSSAYPMDPALENPFGSIDHTHTQGLTSPNDSCDEGHRSHPHESEDVMFDEFVAHRDDDLHQPSQATEALEDRKCEQIEESGGTLNDFLNEH